MGWFDSITKRDDPLRDLDPTLRAYLEKEAPKQYKTTTEAAADAETSSSSSAATLQQSYREQLGLKPTDPEAQHRQKQHEQPSSTSIHPATSADANANAEQSSRPLPTESLFPDGRYSHLWKTYRPATEVAEAGKSDQEKLLDVVGGYKERQAEVGRAALENCSNEQWAVHECFRSGSWSARVTMCKTENRALNRCISMQSRFLRTLGYLTMQERSAEESEKIQMHADRLYQRMLAEEKADASPSSALTEPNTNPPPQTYSKRDETVTDLHLAGLAFQKELPSLPASPSVPGTITYDSLPVHVRSRLEKEKFAGLEGPALELAKKEMDANIAFHQQAVLRLNERYRTEKEERERRKEAGEERFGDWVKTWFDFRKYGDGDARREGNGNGNGGEEAGGK